MDRSASGSQDAVRISPDVSDRVKLVSVRNELICARNEQASVGLVVRNDLVSVQISVRISVRIL